MGPPLHGGINPRVSLHEPLQESLVTQTLKESAMQKTWVQSLGQEDPLEKAVATHSSILPGKSRGLFNNCYSAIFSNL